jgi:hypothetical protein
MSRDARGRFLPGPDPDRHYLTRIDARKGYMVAVLMGKLPSRLRCWLRNKIRFYYRYRPGR